ncbi:MAG: multicopper oxidase domain-containing protein [Bacteroidetes bacterium]|nr:multicopper oxidase domain-containing protein [Bacteroidota bacterium]
MTTANPDDSTLHCHIATPLHAGMMRSFSVNKEEGLR